MDFSNKVYGWKPDRVDPRDRLFRKIAQPRLTPLPDFVDLRSQCSPVENQDALGACSGNALAGLIEFLDLKAKRPFTDISRLFIYYNERDIEGTVDEDSGAMIRDGIKGLHKLGVCSESLYPYDITKFTDRPSDEAYKDALTRVIHSYDRILTLDEMKGCLADGYPFVFGFTVFSGFEAPQMAADGILNLPGPDEVEVGGHAVLCVGYDEATKRFMIRNSWGYDWGQRGYFTMPYDYMEMFADDFWKVTA